ncbi:MAG: thioredoxin-like domain-containing protein [Verrucomicrobium sp.]|nr:thioredoxin-like domain-containing protein [Verrucomicrobium sp.]
MKTMALSLALLAGFLLGVGSLQADNKVYPEFKGKLVESKGRKMEKFDDTALAQTKYYAIYYSASWCGPCRAFTPDLARWYKRNKAKNPQFELIFVSSDRSEEDMAGYMKEDKMDWPALAFANKSATPGLTKYSGSGIPCLVLIDETGKVLSDSYVNGKYVGPRQVLEDIEKVLKENPATGAAAGTGSGLDRLKRPGT